MIEHPNAPPPNASLPTAIVTVIQVDDLSATVARAARFGASTSDTVSDVTPEGATFREAMITSPGGHAILVYQIGIAAK